MKRKLGRLYVITDRNLIPREKFLWAVERAIRGGAEIIQLREKNTSREEIISLGKKVLEICQKYAVPLIVNDNPEIALRIGAQGVHLGGEDIGIAEAREILGEESIVGSSSYCDLELALSAADKGADYVAFSSPYPSPTKPEKARGELSLYNKAKTTLPIPFYVIGGITPEKVKELMLNGAYGIAVISYVFSPPDPFLGARRLGEEIEKWIT